jgi:predicted N-formylglutamate amidohydrolase
LPQAELDRHIGWDIGIAGTTRALAERLDAWAIEQTYSRLLIDCNRPLASPTLIPEVSDHTVVPGNAGLSAAQRQQRIDAIHAPYHARIDAELDARRDAGRPTLLVMMHSFTPAMNGTQRPWHAGVLYHQDTRFAHACCRHCATKATWWWVTTNRIRSAAPATTRCRCMAKAAAWCTWNWRSART